MVAMAAATASSQLIFSKPRSPSRLCPFQLCVFDTKQVLSSSSGRRRHVGGSGVRCMAVGEAATTETKKRSGYELQTLTNWLLKQEQAGVIDAELTIVLSSISMACKQIASLVQRANISNLTGVQGAVNVQGEDQKKLDVVSNEVSVAITILWLSGLGNTWSGVVSDPGPKSVATYNYNIPWFFFLELYTRSWFNSLSN